MPLDCETPIDRVASRSAQIDVRSLLQGTCLVLIEALGFAANVLLVVLGLPLFAFLLLAGWDLGLLLAQLGNLADHYANAEPLARRMFGQDLKVAFLLAAGGYSLVRLPAFLKRLESRLKEGRAR